MSAEWSAMCGSGLYPAGGKFDPATGWCAENSADRTHPAGTKTPTGAGFHDLSGNVFEWAIAKAKSPEPKNRKFFDLEARGGSFRSDDKHPKTLGKAPSKGSWDWISNGVAVPELGFRVVRTITP
jgi:formylglycine-generating enzyme required for sulfatase activity